MFSLPLLPHQNQGIVYCTCGQFLVDSESRRKFNKLRLNALYTIPNYVIKKGRSHGARHGTTEEQKEYQKAWNAWKRCCKKVDSQGGHFTGIHDRFLRDPVYRELQLAIGWTEQKCKEMDELAQEDHTYHLTPEEKKRYQGQWYLTLNKEGKKRTMKLRSDFRAAPLLSPLMSSAFSCLCLSPLPTPRLSFRFFSLVLVCCVQRCGSFGDRQVAVGA